MDLRQFFQTLGFDNEQSRVLTFLSKHNKQSILQISRGTGIERTKLYRIIDELLPEGYVIQSKAYKKHYYSIGPVSTFANRKKKELKKANVLKHHWTDFVRELMDKNVNTSTDVRFYHGPQGIRQVLWNELQAKEILCFVYRDLRYITGERWFKKWAKECNIRGVINKELRTYAFDKTKYSKITLQGEIVRYLPKDYEDFHLAVDIYNDIVVLYDWRNEDVFAVEIQNKNFAKFMRMLFYEMWTKGKEQESIEKS